MFRAHLEAAESSKMNQFQTTGETTATTTTEIPLQLAKDIEDFSIGGSDNELDEDNEEADLEVEPALVSPQRGLLSSVARPEIWYKSNKKPATVAASASSSESSRGSKVSNGSAGAPATVNGYIMGRTSNDTRTTQF